MFGSTQVHCEITECSYYSKAQGGRCIAERIAVLQDDDGNMYCDTYEIAELDLDVGPFYDDDDDNEQWEMDWRTHW